MKRFSVALVMLCSSIALADQPAYEFKGLTPGMSYESAIANPKLPKLNCRDHNKLLADKVCNLRYGHRETIAGAPIESLLLTFYDNRLSAIFVVFNTSHFFAVREALTEKYGKGLTEQSIIQNRAGASFDNETVAWPGNEVVMTLTKRSGKIDTGQLRILSKDAIEKFEKRIKKDAGDI